MTDAVAVGLAAPAEAVTEAYVAALESAFWRAAERAGILRRDVSVAGAHVRLLFAGGALDPFVTPAFIACDPEGAPAALTVLCFDSDSTCEPLPTPPWPAEAGAVRGEIRGLSSVSAPLIVQPANRSLQAYRPDTAAGVYWMESAARAPYHDVANPLRPLLARWLATRGGALVHAAAVGRETGGVLVGGGSGAGKSTTALAGVGTGLGYCGDDHVGLAERDGRPEAWCVYGSMRLAPARAHELVARGTVPVEATAPNGDKDVVYLHHAHPARIATRVAIRAVVVPRVAARVDSRLVPMSPARALLALAPSSILPLPGAGETEFAALARLVRAVPCYELIAGSDLAGVGEALRALSDGS